MKDRKTMIGKALSVLQLFTGFLPIALIIGQYLTPKTVLLPVLLAVVLWVTGSLEMFVSARKRLLVTAGALLCAAVLCFCMGGRDNLVIFTLLLPYAIPLLFLAPGMSQPVWEEWPTVVHAIMLVIQLVAQIWLFVRKDFESLSGVLFAVLAVYLLLMLISMNRRNLRDGMLDGQKAPPKVLYRNRGLLFVLYALAMLCAGWQKLGQWVESAWNAIVYAVGAVIHWLMSLVGMQETTGGSTGSGGMEDLAGLAEETEPSWLAKLLEKIAVYVGYAIAAGCIGFALYFLGKKLVKLIRYLIGRMRAYADASALDYVDEQESTLNLEDKAQQFRARVRDMFVRKKETPWENLNGGMRIRRLFLQFMKKKDCPDSLTAQEAALREKNMPGGFADLYDAVRYGDAQVEAAQADAMREKLRQSRMI